MKHKVAVYFLVTLFCLFITPPSYSESDLPPDNLQYPVLLTSPHGHSGSGFFYNTGDATYLVTARHILFEESSIKVPDKFTIPRAMRHKAVWQGDRLTFSGVMAERERDDLISAAVNANLPYLMKTIHQLFKESQKLKLKYNKVTLYAYSSVRYKGDRTTELNLELTTLFDEGGIKYHPSRDVAIIKIGVRNAAKDANLIALKKGVTVTRGKEITGVGKDAVRLFRDVMIGNPVFLFGYPTSITEVDPWLDIKLPLLRKGIIAGKNEDWQAIILDAPAYHGNSGGLALEVERMGITETKYRAIGLVTNLIPFSKRIAPDEPLWFQHSGYSIVVPIDYVEELIFGGVK